jgi:hypothetical protein
LTMPLEQLRSGNLELDDMLRDCGRSRFEVLRSLTTTVPFGWTDSELRARLHGSSADAVWLKGELAGTPTQIIEQLEHLQAVGVERVVARWRDQDDLGGLQAFGETVAARS